MATLDLCTLAYVKQLHGQIGSSDKYDESIESLITAVSRQIEKYVGFGLMQESRTQVLDVEGGQRMFFLDAAPTSSVTSVKVSSQRDFSTDGKFTLLDSDLYTTSAERGVLWIDGYALFAGKQVLQVVHTGGIAANAAGVETAYPDFALACAMEVIARRSRAPNFGVVSHGGQAGSRAFTVPTRSPQLTPEVVGILDEYRRA